jgi:hypothetical protein
MSKNVIGRTDWSLADIPFDATCTELVRDRNDLFYLVCAASFVEIAADLYSDNLATHYEEHGQVVAWLRGSWQPEEVQHGRALRDYVRHVWPAFDWDQAYAGFFAEYSKSCTIEAYEPTLALEMVARCVVETGTASFYQTLEEISEESVLKGIATRIRADEIRHYKHFYRYFRELGAEKPPSRWQILRAITRRLLEARQHDTRCALWHAYSIRNAGRVFDERDFDKTFRQLVRQFRQRFPIMMATKMLLKPLGLPSGISKALVGPVVAWTGWVFRR